MTIECKLVDYSNPEQAQDLVGLLDTYAQDPMGGNQPLTETTKQNLVTQLSARPFAFSVIAYNNGEPAGLANCFEGFSTFKCKPLVNIHDLAVAKEHRGKKISLHLLDKIESIAKEKGCCKITLEVLDGNIIAKSAYVKFGFEGYELDPKLGKALFWEKPLN